MKLIVFGASGATGREVVRRALSHGHALRAFARDRAKLQALPGVDVALGDVREASSVVGAVAGQDAVVLALGSGSLGRNNLLMVGSANVIAAMQSQGICRLIVLGAAGAIPGAARNQGPLGRALFRILTGTLLRNVMRDQGAMEAQMAASELDYTIVRPARLTNGAETGMWRVDPKALPAHWRPIARADVATFMLQQLGDTTYSRMGVYISK